MKRTLVIITLLPLAFLLPVFLIAQVKHELKSDIRTFYAHDNISSEIRLMYELVAKPKVGFEIDVNYIWDNVSIPDSITTFPIFLTSYQNFDREYLKIGLTAKSYLSKKKNAAGFYLGLFNAYQIETYREADYKEKYKEVFNRDPKIYTLQLIVLGGSIGYKFLIIKRVILELNIRMGFDILAPIREDYFNIEGDGFIKVGYRFGKNSE